MALVSESQREWVEVVEAVVVEAVVVVAVVVEEEDGILQGMKEADWERGDPPRIIKQCRTLTTSFLSETALKSFSGHGKENSGARKPSSRKSVSTRAWTRVDFLALVMFETQPLGRAVLDTDTARCILPE
jgi:hypothetical protein